MDVAWTDGQTSVCSNIWPWSSSFSWSWILWETELCSGKHSKNTGKTEI